MSRSVLVWKLCTLWPHHPTRKAIFEFDKLVRSIYTLKYLRDPQLQRSVHRSQNRIESYHQLRAFLAEVSGKKYRTGRTDLDVAIRNECGRLIANVVIAYNSILLSMLLNRYQVGGRDFWSCSRRSRRWRGSTFTCWGTTYFGTTTSQSI